MFGLENLYVVKMSGYSAGVKDVKDSENKNK